jgi:DNA-binding response OmpR family regulator
LIQFSAISLKLRGNYVDQLFRQEVRVHKILIVDDDELTRKMLEKRLSKRGFDVTTVNGGKECLDYLENHETSLILLDIMMPSISGLETLRILRKTYSKDILPVIIVTGKSEDKDIVESLQIGANDFLSKPVSIDVAIARIENHLAIKESHDLENKQKELSTINSMIVTYNHEINNPLTIALSGVRRAINKKDYECLESVQRSLERVQDIVARISSWK